MGIPIISRRPEFLTETPESVIRLGQDWKGGGIHLDSSSMRQHTLVLGSVSDERTDLLLTAITAAFAAGSGGIYVNANADPGIAERIRSVAEKHGRFDDLTILDLRGRNASENAISFNPFESASAERVTEIVIDTCTEFDSVDLNMRALMAPLARALCWLRDNKGEYLDGTVIAALLDRARLEAFAGREDVPTEIRDPLLKYLRDTGPHVHERVHMGISRMAATIVENFDVFASGRSDIDFAEIRSKRKFLLVLLPALETSPDSVCTTARLVIASLKAALADILYTTSKSPFSQDVVGRYDAGDMPFVCILDDAPYYLPGQVSLMLAQARALGIAVVAGTGDLNALYQPRQWGPSEGIGSSVMTTIVMQLETWHLAINETITSASYGRRSVPRSLRPRRGDKPFASARLYAKGLGSNEFIVLKSGQMVQGFLEPRKRRSPEG
jgi:hypothetical protein